MKNSEHLLTIKRCEDVEHKDLGNHYHIGVDTFALEDGKTEIEVYYSEGIC